MPGIPVSTIGFTRSSAEGFFRRLIEAGVRTVIDVRLHNTSQLAGFAKADDLAFFLKELGDIRYVPEPMLAPTEAMFKALKRDRGEWTVFESGFLTLMRERQVETRFEPEMLRDACLLCSEATPHHCHRRLVLECLNDRWGNPLAVRHL